MFDNCNVDMNEALFPFKSQIAEREQVLCALAMASQKRVAIANSRIKRAFIDGVGEVVASITPDIYHRLGREYGYETINSDDFMRTLLRDNPEMRVKCVSRKSGIVVPNDSWKESADARTGSSSMKEEGRRMEHESELLPSAFCLLPSP